MVNEGVLYDLMNLSRGKVLLQTPFELRDPVPLGSNGRLWSYYSFDGSLVLFVYAEHQKQWTHRRCSRPRQNSASKAESGNVAGQR